MIVGGEKMEYREDMRNRLRRIEGQVRGVIRMMDEQKECKEIISQMSAIRTALDRAMAYIVGTNLEQCIRKELEKGKDGDTDQLVQEALELLVKSR